MAELLPCPSCHRHVNDREHACPFCRTPLWRRGAMLAAMTLSATGLLLGCESTVAAAYGGPPPPTTVTATPAPSAASSGASSATSQPSSRPTVSDREGADMYGAPPPPAGDEPPSADKP